ncbi:hypothetical protein Ciccas_011436 [Cichlidogyrus casuarinus]|uniref:Uncharacterized protein n=1 Tax=Cichlidogyrus casuarinus TaxID=1844966 RepID=A0ABD2PR91_9PLAT
MLFPVSLAISTDLIKNEFTIKPNGGFKDVRDRALCSSIATRKWARPEDDPLWSKNPYAQQTIPLIADNALGSDPLVGYG